MITKQTAADLWNAYHEIEMGEDLLAKLEEQQREHGDAAGMLDAFGRRRSLQLGLPSGTGHRLLDLRPSLAVQVIRAHIAQKKAELGLLNERARAELDNVVTNPSPTRCPEQVAEPDACAGLDPLPES